MSNGTVRCHTMSDEPMTVGDLDIFNINDKIQIEIHRKRIKNMYLRVEPGGHVILSAPQSLNDSAVLEFLNEKRLWLIKQYRQMSSLASVNSLAYENGDVVYYRGRPYTLHVVPDRAKSLTITDTGILLCIQPPAAPKEKKAFFNEQMRLRLIRILYDRVHFWEEQMAIKCSSFVVRDMKSRWGSCHVVTGKLTFNLHLIEFEPICTDYVVVHELAHLRFPSHDKNFWSLVETYIPDYKRIRQQLNEPKRVNPDFLRNNKEQ